MGPPLQALSGIEECLSNHCPLIIAPVIDDARTIFYSETDLGTLQRGNLLPHELVPFTFKLFIKLAGPSEDCSNLVDDDGDLLMDCLDPDCHLRIELCGNGEDDDCDFLVDSADDDCPQEKEICDNQIDDDADGFADCDDRDCNSEEACCPIAQYGSGRRFAGSPILADKAFFPTLDLIDSIAANNNVFIYVTGSFRPKGYNPNGPIVPPAVRSNHLVGHAIDINVDYFDQAGKLKRCGGPTIGNCLGMASLPAPVAGFIQGIQASGLRWGGTFSKPDVVHIDDGYNGNASKWDELFEKIQKSCTKAALVSRIHSPIDVIVIDPSGRRLGVDSDGRSINDFGNDGYDSGPGEPRTYSLLNPLEGQYAIKGIGIGDGDFTIEFYQALNSHISEPLHEPLSFSGTVRLGQIISYSVVLSPEHPEGFFEGTIYQFHRGDPNSSGTTDISDGVAILGFLFLGTPASFDCLESADTNNDARIDISDGVAILQFLFNGTAAPASPGPTGEPCGLDVDPPGSQGDLGCALYDKCE
jgi:hypothetical protein